MPMAASPSSAARADHLVRVRGPAQEREVGGRHQLGEGGHDVTSGRTPRGVPLPLVGSGI